MSRYKKLLSIMLTMVLILSMVMPVVAESSDVVAKIGDAEFTTLQAAFDAVKDGETISILKDITFTAETSGYDDGTYIDGVRYAGDKSFTVDFGGFTVTDNGDVNDYMFYMNNKGEKPNAITFTNGTIVSKNGCWATVCLNAGSSIQHSLLHLNGMKISNKFFSADYGHDVIRARNLGTVNLNNGTVITSDGASGGVNAIADGIINVNAGASIVQQNSKPTAGNYVGTAVTGTGTVNIYDGATITSDNYGVHNSTTLHPIINIYGGTITAPIALKASTNGGNDQSATINVYGGTINGALEEQTAPANIWLYGGTFPGANMGTLSAYLPANVSVTLDGNGTLVPSSNAVASIYGSGYTTLQAAIDAAKVGDTITLLSNIELDQTVTVPADKVITLDLNGHTISLSYAQTAAYQLLDSKGDLTIKDSGTDGKISYTDTGAGGEYISDTIKNSGKLTVLSGTIENLSAIEVARNGYPHAIDTWGEVIIKGGTIKNSHYSAIRIWSDASNPVASVTIEDGTIVNAIDLHNVNEAPNTGSLTIKGGTFNVTNSTYNGTAINGAKYSVRLVNFGTNTDNVTASIEGGTFNGGFATAGSVKDVSYLKKVLTLTGGSFKEIYSDYAAEGYACDVKVGDYYVVHQHDSKTDIPAEDATCTETGKTAGKKCSVCGTVTVAQTETPVADHNWSTDFKYGAETHWNYCLNKDCTAKKNEGTHTFGEHQSMAHVIDGNDCALQFIQSCSVCMKGLESKTFWVAKENPVHAYDEGVVTTAPTCKVPGVKTYTCQNEGCGHKKTEEVAVIAHTEVEIPAVEATCTETGKTAGKKCSVCGTVTVAQTEVAKKAHTEVEIPAVEATCTQPGKTAGKKCSVCGTVTVAQTEVAAKGHTLTPVAATAATYFAAGNIEHYTCACGKLFADAEAQKELTAADVVIAQLVKIEDTTADVSTEVVDEVIKEAETAGTVDIVITVTQDKLAEDEKEESTTPDSETSKPAPAPVVTKTQLPVAAVKQVAELHEEATLTINMTNATVTMDKTTLDVVTEKAKTEQTDVISLEIEHIETKALAPAQQKAVEEKKVAAVISASILVNDKEVHDFEGGKVTVAIPFKPEAGTTGSDYVVLYIADDGSVEEIPTAYANGTLVMTLSHFSEYVVVNTAVKDTTNPSTGDSFSPILMVCLLAVSAAAIVVLSGKKRFAK